MPCTMVEVQVKVRQCAYFVRLRRSRQFFNKINYYSLSNNMQDNLKLQLIFKFVATLLIWIKQIYFIGVGVVYLSLSRLHIVHIVFYNRQHLIVINNVIQVTFTKLSPFNNKIYVTISANSYSSSTDTSRCESPTGKQDVLRTFRSELGRDQIVYGAAGRLVCDVRAARPLHAPPCCVHAAAQQFVQMFLLLDRRRRVDNNNSVEESVEDTHDAGHGWEVNCPREDPEVSRNASALVTSFSRSPTFIPPKLRKTRNNCDWRSIKKFVRKVYAFERPILTSGFTSDWQICNEAWYIEMKKRFGRVYDGIAGGSKTSKDDLTNLDSSVIGFVGKVRSGLWECTSAVNARNPVPWRSSDGNQCESAVHYTIVESSASVYCIVEELKRPNWQTDLL